MKLKSSITAASHRELLSTYPRFSKRERNWVKKNLSDDFTKLIIVICNNTHNTNASPNNNNNIDNDALKKFLKNKKRIADLMNPHSSLDKRGKLIQLGSFLQAHLPNFAIPNKDSQFYRSFWFAVCNHFPNQIALLLSRHASHKKHFSTTAQCRIPQASR